MHLTKQQAQAISDAREMAKWAHGRVGGVGSRTQHIAVVLSQLLDSASVSDDPSPRLLLTDAEREAVQASQAAMRYAADELGLSSAECDRMVAALHGLLERTLATHTNPDEGSAQDSVA